MTNRDPNEFDEAPHLPGFGSLRRDSVLPSIEGELLPPEGAPIGAVARPVNARPFEPQPVIVNAIPSQKPDRMTLLRQLESTVNEAQRAANQAELIAQLKAIRGSAPPTLVREAQRLRARADALSQRLQSEQAALLGERIALDVMSTNQKPPPITGARPIPASRDDREVREAAAAAERWVASYRREPNRSDLRSAASWALEIYKLTVDRHFEEPAARAVSTARAHPRDSQTLEAARRTLNSYEEAVDAHRRLLDLFHRGAFDPPLPRRIDDTL